MILIIDDLENITFLRRQQCQLSLIQRKTCTTFCHCDCEEWVACFLEFFSAGYGSHSGALCHQTSHSEVKYCLQNFSDIMSSNVSKVDRVFCLIHTSHFIDKFCIHIKKFMLTKNTYHLWSCTGSKAKASMILKKKTKEFYASVRVFLSPFFSGRESERKLAVQLAPSSELPSDSSWTSGRPDTLTHGHLDDLAPDKKVQPPHSPRDFFWQIATFKLR